MAPEVANPLLVDARQAARLLSVSPRTLFSLTKTGRIPVVRIGRATRYSPKDLEKFIDRNRRNEP